MNNKLIWLDKLIWLVVVGVTAIAALMLCFYLGFLYANYNQCILQCEEMIVRNGSSIIRVATICSC